MSNREKVPEYIDRYNNGELTGEDLNTFIEMLRTNPRLREEVKLDSELNEILAQTDILELRKKILYEQKHAQKGKGPNLKSFLIAASLLFLFGIEVILIMNKTNHHPSPPIGTHISNLKPELPKSSFKNEIAKQTAFSETRNKASRIIGINNDTSLSKRFRKNIAFEKMIGSTRHSGYFLMNTPRMGYIYGKKMDIHFEWNITENEEIELKIIDNAGESVYESGLINTNRYLLPSGTLLSGLYYFRVLQNDEIIFFGKFVIE
jgi:hypothetical protein